ncbi:MAG TPA: hypothetical protein VG937_07765 [Polyangiaceae bacterium]|jgi:hypothetical protein|nr:hypothetical protein [Polyangiaceae bacterium]
MSNATRADPPQPARYANVLFGAAGLIVLSLLFNAARPRLLLSLAAGWCGSVTLSHFAWAYRRVARAGLRAGQAAPGRIVEQRATDGSLSLVMPAAGTEPWTADSFIVWVAAAAAAAGGALLESGDRALLGLLAALLVILGFRVASAPSDRLRFEISNTRWAVDAVAGGRPIHRSGSGPLLPQLVEDALVIWSTDGRVGVLRGELEPEERVWLANRLGVLAETSTLSAEANREVDEREADHERQEQEAERGE